ncbi:hypothetical protein Tco_0081036 [Tanacetum coccineum]
MQAKPDNEDCNMKFLRALPPSWVAQVMIQEVLLLLPIQLLLADSQNQPPSITFTTASSSADASSNVIENVLHSFVAESDPQQQITYEDFDQIEKLDLEI